MSLKTGFALLIGLAIGAASTVHLYGGLRDRQITGLQIAQCTKGDKPRL